ncbi:MAG: tetratricopeptide repeat protein, partial [Candidatus Omnitrophica bacterium]|nr:tetratricopeptide repeat protein [Candidatus Omnitrophota bacterium]
MKWFGKNIILISVSLFLAAAAFAAQATEEGDFLFARKAFRDGFYDLAGERLESILRNYPNTPRIYEAHSLLGRSYLRQNNLPRALYEFEVDLNAPAGSDSQDEALYWL